MRILMTEDQEYLSRIMKSFSSLQSFALRSLTLLSDNSLTTDKCLKYIGASLKYAPFLQSIELDFNT